jgi:hypothetical protein
VKRRIYECPFAAFMGVLALASLVHAQAASATLGGTLSDIQVPIIEQSAS